MASKMVRMSQLSTSPLTRSVSMETFMVRIYLGSLSQSAEFISVEAAKNTKSEEIVKIAVEKLRIGKAQNYELAETFSSGGQICKERRVEASETPVKIQLLWPRVVHPAIDSHRTEYGFYLRRKNQEKRVTSWVELTEPNPVDTFLSTFLQQPRNKEYPDLCLLPDLNETTMLQNLRSRFDNGNIYTYVGSILIAMNPFKFYPIYNPKYVKMYQNRRLGDLPPHIFAIADASYHTMLQEKCNQCIVISGESGSGKTESTNLLLHHLSALSQRGLHSSGIEQTILGAGPVLEAFGNAKTVHNNNSSRFGKFIQVNYRENGMVHGAVVEKYLLEKSRIVAQAPSERNYHVFYYLLAGAGDNEKEQLQLSKPQDYFYLNQSNCYVLEGLDGERVDEAHEFQRLRQSMEMVGFSTDTQRRIFCVLAAVLHLGNLQYKKKSDHQHHDAVTIKNTPVLKTISNLLKVKESTLTEALTKKKTMAGGETVIMSYNMIDAIATRDAMAKCLYGGLFEWIVLQVNHALLAKREHRDHQGQWIGVLDIFGFEDFALNSFEQFCINFANEHLHYYFNQHIFKFEQEEYLREGIQWKNIEFIDNTECLDLFAKKPTGLLYLLDEECNFPGATNSTLLAKFHASHQNHPHYEVPQMKENAFSVVHYAGKVKFHIEDFREKNSDLMRHDIMLVLKNSSLAFVRELVGYDPVAVLRWAILRSFFRAYFAFIDAGKRHRKAALSQKFGALMRRQSPSSRSAPHHLSMTGDMSSGKKVIIVEKTPNKHASYHGDIHFFLGDAEEAAEDAEEASEQGESMRVWQALTSPSGPGKSPQRFIYGDPKVMRRASRVIMKNKSFKPKTCPTKGFRDLKSLKTLTGRSYLSPRSSKGKNKPPSVSAQFNISLAKLMETLNQANPFFVRCIKSNADKAACKFDEDLVLRQLRYTGMLATVRIRQSGYNYRLTFEEFIDQYKILLPSKELGSAHDSPNVTVSKIFNTMEFIQQYKVLLPKGLVSSKDDVRMFLQQLDFNQENYQIGKSKVFLREAEKLLLDDTLHRAILQRIVHIQRWLKTHLERKRFLRLRAASVIIQCQVRSFLAQRHLERLKLQFYATILIQKVFRGWRTRKQQAVEHQAATAIQRHWKGHTARVQFEELKKTNNEQENKQAAELQIAGGQDIQNVNKNERVCGQPEDGHLHLEPGELHSSTSDEGILTKDSSTEEIYQDASRITHRHDSEESSGILDDSEPEQVSPDLLAQCPVTSPSSTAVLSREYPHAPAHKTVPLTSWPEDRLLQERDVKSVVTVQTWEPDSKTDRYETIVPPPHVRTPPQNPTIPPESRPQIRAQAGPHDVEDQTSNNMQPSVKHKSGLSRKPRRYQRSHRIQIRPAVQKTSSSDVFEEYEGESVQMADKQVAAPLARQESLEDKLDELGNKTHVQKTDDSQAKKNHSPEVDVSHHCDAGELRQDSTEDQSGGVAYVSPLHRAKKHIKNFVGDKELWEQAAHIELGPGSTSNMDNKLLPPFHGVSSEQTSSTLTSHNVTQMTFTHSEPHGKVTKVIEVKTMPDGKVEETKTVKKHSSTTSFMRYSKLSLRSLLDRQNSGRKHSKKDSAEDSEDSLGEDGSSLPAAKSPGLSGEDSIQTGHSRVKEAWPAPKYPQESRKKSRRKGSKKRRQISDNEREKEKKLEKENVTWSLSSTSQWQYPTDILVKDVVELKQLDQFVFNKILELSRDFGRRDTVFDTVFKGALKEFHNSLITHSSIALLEGQSEFRYKELMSNFEETLKARAQEENVDSSFPVTMGINAFRGFLDEFNNKKKHKELPKVEVKKEKKKKEKDQVYEHLGHKFYGVQTSIPTFCEHCSSLLWMMERGYVCQICKFTVHRKCCSKSLIRCRGTNRDNQGDGERRVIGAALASLVDVTHKVPVVVERLITAIEINGLYTVGIYRKPGAAGKVRQLTKALNTVKDVITVDFDEYPVHVLTTVMKSFFREMPEPLLSFELYDDFVRSTECTDEKDRSQAVFSVIEKLPEVNHTLMERLMFHLAKVAQHESYNRMSANGLAIIFAPSILRTSRSLPAQESLSHVPKQTRCIQTIIDEQMRKIRTTLADIKTLDTATASASDRLTVVRASMRTTSPKTPRHDSCSDLSSSSTSIPSIVETDEDRDARAEEQLLSDQIRSLQQEKDELTIRLPELVCRHSSSEEDLLSTDDVDSAGDELDEHHGFEEYAVTFDLPAVSPPKNIRHLNKHRVSTPTRRLPSKRPLEDDIDALDSCPQTPQRRLSTPQLKQIGDEIIV